MTGTVVVTVSVWLAAAFCASSTQEFQVSMSTVMESASAISGMLVTSIVIANSRAVSLENFFMAYLILQSAVLQRQSAANGRIVPVAASM